MQSTEQHIELFLSSGCHMVPGHESGMTPVEEEPQVEEKKYQVGQRRGHILLAEILKWPCMSSMSSMGLNHLGQMLEPEVGMVVAVVVAGHWRGSPSE